MDLLQLRDEIDVIDKQIVELYEKRVNICKQVAEYKIEKYLTVSGKRKKSARSKH